jgi:hypothetical protein
MLAIPSGMLTAFGTAGLHGTTADPPHRQTDKQTVRHTHTHTHTHTHMRVSPAPDYMTDGPYLLLFHLVLYSCKANRQTDRPTDRQTDRFAGRQDIFRARIICPSAPDSPFKLHHTPPPPQPVNCKSSNKSFPLNSPSTHSMSV